MEEPFNLWGAITPSDTVDLPRVTGGILVGSTGNVAAVMQNNVAVTFTALAAGTYLPIAARRVNAAGTTATGLVALYQN